MNATAPLAETIVVDTNPLHRIRMYLHYLNAQNPGHDPTSELGMSPAFLSSLDRNMKSSVEIGHRCLSYLLSLTGARIVYGPMVVLEHAGGMVKAQLVKKFADESAPLRQWSHMGERDVKEYFEIADYNEVANQLAEAKLAREAVGLLSNDPSNDELSLLWQLAPRVVSQVPLADKDAIVYATALAVQANALVTYDDHFGKVCSGLKDPASALRDGAVYAAARADLLDTMHRLTGIEVDDLIMPEHKKP